jgi:hypothetical protein
MLIDNLLIHTISIYKCSSTYDSNRGSIYKSYASSGTAKCRFRPTTSVTQLIQGVTRVNYRAILYYRSSVDITQFDRVEFEGKMWDVISVVDNNKMNEFKTALLQRI